MTGEDGAVGQHGGRESWADVHRRLSEAAAQGPLDVIDVERLAEAAYFLGRDDESDRAWEHAHQVWLRLGDVDRAARAAFWLGFCLMLRGEGAPANGWFGRAGRLVAGAGTECAAKGYLLIPAAMEALESGDVARTAELYAEAGAIAERCGDRDLLAISMLGRGEAALAAGDARAGLGLLDEVMVFATTGEVSPMTTGVLYCAVVDACVHANDIRRASEWTDALTRWCEQQPDMVPYRGACLVHRAQVFQAHGAWAEALVEARRAEERLGDPPHPALGAAAYQLAELHRLRGDVDAAEAAYRQASEHGRDPAPGLALLGLAQGRIPAAAAAARRMLEERRLPTDRLSVLPAFVEVMLAAGDVDAAAEASAELRSLAERSRTPYVQAAADHAAAALLIARGEAGGALDFARRACRVWRALSMPYEAARSQVVVALACRAQGDVDTAAVELEAARQVFERLGAAPDVRRTIELAAQPAGSAEPAHNAGLTDRECEVLRLVAAGRTNRDIGAALVISEHTVARHLQNVFTKLGVSSRAAATAYAYEHGIV